VETAVGRTRLLLAVSFLAIVVAEPSAQANWTSRFSLATGELFSDNIFFSQDKEYDFVSMVIPSLSLAYKPSGYPEPTLTASLSSPVEIFARNSDLNNIGDNIWLQANYIYRYSPRLDFTLSERLLRRGESRTGRFGGVSGDGGGGIGGGGLGGGGMSGGFGGLSGVSGFGSSGFGGGGGGCSGGGLSGGGLGLSSGGDGTVLDEGDLVTRGERLQNQLGGDARFQYTQNLDFRGGYCWDSIWFLGSGGRETAHSFNIEGNYRFRRQHNFRVRYRISLLQLRDGTDDIVHDFDIGDDFISQQEIRLTPTLTLRASTGISLARGNSGENKFRLENRLNVELIRVWRTAQLTMGVNRGLTSSYGVSGPSFTTRFFSRFSIQVSQRLAGFAGAEYSLFDAEDADFETLQAFLGLQYWFTSWLSANLAYSYQWTGSQSGSLAQESLGSGDTDSHSVFLFFAVHFDIWPNWGLARDGAGVFGGPAVRSPARRSSGRPFP